MRKPELCYLVDEFGVTLEIPNVAYYGGYKVGQDEMKKGKKFKMAKKRPTEDWTKK